MRRIRKESRLIIILLLICSIFFAGCREVDDVFREARERIENETEETTITPTKGDEGSLTPEVTLTESPTSVPTETPILTETPSPTPIPTVESQYTLWYTSNSDEEAKEGNTGEFSYLLREEGVNYDEYLIIDFENGYCYFWQVGDGSKFYVRYKIESGDLNSGVVIKGYLDSEYTMTIKCKRIGQTGALIGTDSSNDSFELFGTDLETAHKLMNQRIMVDASKPLDPMVTPTPSIMVNEFDFTNNDAQKALEGDSGLYSYGGKDQNGDDIYIVFDFENGFVYYVDTGEEYYARFMLAEGNLKTGAKVFVYNPQETITWNVKFRDESNISELVIITSKNATSWIQRTNLKNAIAEMQKRYMLDRSVPGGQVVDDPTPVPSPEPTYTPIPTNTPAPVPTSTPTPVPTNTPTPAPTSTPTPVPTNTPTPVPTSTPTPVPTNTPTPKQEKGTSSTSKNSKEAKEGKTGLFAYVTDKKGNVFTHVLINFDENYVDFIFNDGNDEYVVRGLIMEGNLNDGLIVACKSGENVVVFAIHFKWQNMYENLVVLSQNGLTLTYVQDNLSDLKKKISKLHIEDCRK